MKKILEKRYNCIISKYDGCWIANFYGSYYNYPSAFGSNLKELQSNIITILQGISIDEEWIYNND